MVDSPLSVGVVFPGGADGVGGAEIQALTFLQTCDRSRIEPELVLLGRNPTFERRVAEGSINCVRKLNAADRHPWDPRTVVEFERFLRERRYDLIYLFGLRQEIMTRPVSQISARPCVVSAIRGMESHRTFLHTWLNRITARWVDFWVSNSESTRHLFISRDRLPANKIIVVANGVAARDQSRLSLDRANVRRELRLADDECACVCVANLLPPKRQADLIRAVAGVAAAGDRVRLFLIGRELSYAARLRKLIIELGVGAIVELLGYRDDVSRVLAGMDVMALASEKEGMPMAVLEGMAAGLPVLATPVASLPSIVAEAETGYLVPVGDIDCWRQRLSEVVRNGELRHSLGEAGRRRVEAEFSVARMTNRLTTVFEDLVRKGSLR